MALVTGGAMGIGAAAVRAFAAEGACVVIADIAIDAGAALAEVIGPTAMFAHHDVTNAASWEGLIVGCLTKFGGLDIVMNNAGLVSLGTVESVTDEDWARHRALHLEAAALGTRLGIRAIRGGGRAGSIINVASTSTIKGYSPHFAYLAAKGAVRGLTRASAAYCTAQRLPIRCNCIIPGGILTPMAEVFVEMTKTMPGDVEFRSSAGRDDREDPLDISGLGQPEDVAALALYLGSDESKFMNGAELVIDNGASRMSPLRSTR